MNGNIETIMSVGQLVVTAVGIVTAILIPLMVGLIKIHKAQQQTNVRLDHVEKTTADDAPKMDKIIDLDSRVKALEKHRNETEPARIQMIQMLSVINTKLDANTESMKAIWSRINNNAT
jgi:hypothetical protein